jgi:hypothetical protein
MVSLALFSARSTRSRAASRTARALASARVRVAVCSVVSVLIWARQSRIRARRPPPRPDIDGGNSSPRLSPNNASSSASTAAAAATIRSASARNLSSVRLASIEAFAAIFVPSTAIEATRPRPAFAHSLSTCSNKSVNAASCSARNRAIVVWSGMSCAQITRNATSTVHNRSICRDECTRFAYPYNSNVTSMSGSNPDRP